MRSTLILRAANARQPMIKFLGKRKTPQSVDHTPHVHPAAPTQSLPDSFADYRSRSQQHGPIGNKGGNGRGSTGGAAAPAPVSNHPTSTSVASLTPYGSIGGRPGKSLGPVAPKQGEFFDRNELPARFRRTSWSEAEIDAVTSGGASTVG